MRNMQIGWPAVAALAVVVTGLVIAAIFVPAETWAALARVPWETIAGFVLSLGGIAATAAVGPLLSKRPPGGGAALLFAIVLGGTALSGCGSGMTAIGVASASRTAVCLVCEKLATLGACPGGEEPEEGE